MTRHFLQLYLLIVATLLAASWAQERLWQVYSGPDREDPAQAAALILVQEQLLRIPAQQRKEFVRQSALNTGLDLELFDAEEISGAAAATGLLESEVASMEATDGETWLLKRVDADGRVLVLKNASPRDQRSMLEWSLVFAFYATIAMVIMIWLWPLTRDLRMLERATMNFGNRNWKFDADIGTRSQVYPLAQAFAKMASRIDALIGSHKDLSNAVAHEIKTPLARMRFEAELAHTATSMDKVREHLRHIDADIASLDKLVTATLSYAILERADMALNVTAQNFTELIPTLAQQAREDAPPGVAIRSEVQQDAIAVNCDGHLLETVLRNLLYNAIRHARSEVRVSFSMTPHRYVLRVLDDGPGIPEPHRERVFQSFVQLADPGGVKGGFGLGLAIVKRIVEWHGGTATVATSTLGGAQFEVSWPPSPALSVPCAH